MKDSNKKESKGTVGPSKDAPPGDVWDDPEFKKLDELTRKLVQVPKKELDEVEKTRSRKNKIKRP